MSYICHATGTHVTGVSRELVPVEVRKVIYIAQTKPDPRSEYLQFAGQSEGWEVVKEVPVQDYLADSFRDGNPPRVVGEKEVRFVVKSKPRTPTNLSSLQLP